MELQSGLIRVASYRRKLPRKKNIYLPTEVWVDVFCFPWISHPKRPKLAQMVDQIGNRWFGELQFYLHEWGKHTLGELYFKQQGVCKWHNGQYQPLEYPQTAMPENIKFCETFRIDHFDNQVFNFFRRIQSVLATNTTLEIRHISKKEVDNARTILGHLLPLIDGIYTVIVDDQTMPALQLFPPEKFRQIKVLDVDLTRFVQFAMQLIIKWLTINNNEPKLLHLYCADGKIERQVVETIRQQFMEATEPSTFAVIFCYCDLINFNCENGIGEQLCGMRAENGKGFKVYCHQANDVVAGEQLRKWMDDMYKKEVYDGKQCIRLSNPTIGDGPIFALPDLDVDKADEKEDESAKPSSPKKRRICK